MHSHLIDIDELVLLCRDDEAKKYIAEAVASYKIGAFRACIVMTWIAVLYDFLYKLRELELSGDKQATAKLQEFEHARITEDYNLSLKFERDVLKVANEDFEFINDVERKELERLLDDRNRCAHPSMVSSEEIYSPSSELARYHLRNAVLYLLQYPPTQGQSYIDNLLRETESPYFPTELSAAIVHYQSKSVERAKNSVISNLASAMVKGLFLENFDSLQFTRTATALNALRNLRRTIVEDSIAKHLSNVINRLEDEQLHKVFQFFNIVEDTDEYLRDDIIIRLKNYLKSTNANTDDVEPLHVSLDIPTFKEFVIEIIHERDEDTLLLAKLMEYKVRPEFVKPALAIYENSWSFASANNIATSLIKPLIKEQLFEETDVETLFIICTENGQVFESYEFEDILRLLPRFEIISNDALEEMFSRFESVKERYRSVVFPDDINNTDDPPF